MTRQNLLPGFELEPLSAEVIPAAPDVPDYDDMVFYWGDPKVVRDRLERLDWSFTDDATAFLTHDIHPYPAKFIPQIPGHLISALSNRGELVLDPFGGSGTAALEAVRLGRRAVSIDANPVASLIGRVKISRLDAEAGVELAGLHAAIATELMNLPGDAKVLVDQYSAWIPEIANREKWFCDAATGELALIRSRIGELESNTANNIATLAMSRMVLKVSFQDSETRYKSTPRKIVIGEALERFLKELEWTVRSLQRAGAATRYGVSEFITGDFRTLPDDTLPPLCADVIVTSPPYGNANDYHLYHRFRLLWLGFNPMELGRIEIGSHLKHQREGNGFDSYLEDLKASLARMHRALKPGRYAALVLGDALYEGKVYPTAAILCKEAEALGGFDSAFCVTRPVHKTKRSFVIAGRRVLSEKILILRKTPAAVRVRLEKPPYRLFEYEETLRRREVQTLASRSRLPDTLDAISLDPAALSSCRGLVFSHQLNLAGGFRVPTWQSILENGMAASTSNRKDPKYVTHGLHPYKGKFYPQLAKALLNVASLPEGSVVLDPFCGSGTTLLEGFLNGFRTRGIDMNPLAAMIARAKVGVLELSPEVVTEAVEAILSKVAKAPTILDASKEELAPECLDEIERWFAEPVIWKLNWLLKTIRRTSAGHIRDYLCVVLSSIIREVSQQDPNDLRIRYRSSLLKDADVFGLFRQQLSAQFERLQKFWSIRGYATHKFFPASAVEGDSRLWGSLNNLGIEPGSVDALLTSPPYATALPYIDTDRLSLLVILGISSQSRRPLEQRLIGSREIITSEKKRMEEEIEDAVVHLNLEVGQFLARLHNRLSRLSDIGFRRKNMPALLLRFFRDMKAVLVNCHAALRPDGQAMIVIGDNRMEVDGVDKRIPTTDFVASLAESVGFSLVETFDISVTTENLVHIKNAITQNVVLRLRRI